MIMPLPFCSFRDPNSPFIRDKQLADRAIRSPSTVPLVRLRTSKKLSTDHPPTKHEVEKKRTEDHDEYRGHHAEDQGEKQLL